MEVAVPLDFVLVITVLVRLYVEDVRIHVLEAGVWVSSAQHRGRGGCYVMSRVHVCRMFANLIHFIHAAHHL